VDRVEPGLEPVRQPPLAEPRSDHVPDDRRGDGVGQGRLQPVAHLEPHLPVVQEDQEDHAVVEPLLADPPRLGETDGEVLEVLAFERPEDRHDDLVRAALLPAGELLLEAVAVGGRQRAGVVVHPPRRRRGDRQGARGEGGDEQQQEGEAGHRPAEPR
jgi:hypothetical protein